MTDNKNEIPFDKFQFDDSLSATPNTSITGGLNESTVTSPDENDDSLMNNSSNNSTIGAMIAAGDNNGQQEKVAAAAKDSEPQILDVPPADEEMSSVSDAEHKEAEGQEKDASGTTPSAAPEVMCS